MGKSGKRGRPCTAKALANLARVNKVLESTRYGKCGCCGRSGKLEEVNGQVLARNGLWCEYCRSRYPEAKALLHEIVRRIEGNVLKRGWLYATVRELRHSPLLVSDLAEAIHRLQEIRDQRAEHRQWKGWKSQYFAKDCLVNLLALRCREAGLSLDFQDEYGRGDFWAVVYKDRKICHAKKSRVLTVCQTVSCDTEGEQDKTDLAVLSWVSRALSVPEPKVAPVQDWA